MGSEGELKDDQAGHQFLLRRWKDFCYQYNNISSYVEDLNKDKVDLSRFVWLQGFGLEGVGGKEEEEIIKFFTGPESEFEGILNIRRVTLGREGSDFFTLSFISSFAAASFVSQEIEYGGKTLTCFLLSDLEKRIKLESRARNFRDETMYRESDMGRRMVLIVDTDNRHVEKEDLLKILVGEDKLVTGLEHVFRSEIDEGHSRYFSGLFILTFKDNLSAVNPELLKNTQIIYVGLLKDYITDRSQIIKENPICIRVLCPPPLPIAPLVRDLSGIALASEDQNRFSLELTGFASRSIDIREYVIKIMKLEYADSKEKVTEANWCEVQETEDESSRFTVRIGMNLYGTKPEQFVQCWNDKDIKIGGCSIRARIAEEHQEVIRRYLGGE